MLKNTNENTIGLSFDVEDWFTVRNMRGVINEKDWDKLESRARIGLDFILESLEEKETKATFFILGWLAKRYPEIVKEVSSLGHEVASHGYSHRPIDLMNPISFQSDLLESLNVIESITGEKVRGYRAPSFSITKKTAWAIGILKDAGIEYDSSVFSTVHPDYGISNFPNRITEIDGIIEVPMINSHYYGTTIPICGGGYFRMLPYSLIKSALRQTLKRESLVMYFHPWEFDAEQPKIKMPLLKKFRHYVGLNKNKNKFSMLMNDFNFVSISELINLEKEKREIEVVNFNDLFGLSNRSLLNYLQ